jgi:hypothetical protein
MHVIEMFLAGTSSMCFVLPDFKICIIFFDATKGCDIMLVLT